MKKLFWLFPVLLLAACNELQRDEFCSVKMEACMNFCGEGKYPEPFKEFHCTELVITCDCANGAGSIRYRKSGDIEARFPWKEDPKPRSH